MASFDCIIVDDRDDHAVVTLNRPDKRNAVNLQLQDELRAALQALSGRSKAIVLAADGPAFCAGVDLKEAEQRRRSGVVSPTMGEIWLQTLEAIRKHPAIFIAAVNGFALGGGLTLVNTCDLAVASSDATFGMPEVGFGEFPGLAGATTLHRIAPKHAAELVLTADRIDADTAWRFGLVNKVCAPEKLLDEALAMAARVARHRDLTLRVSKRALWQLPGLAWSQAIERGMWLSTVSRGETVE